MYKNKFNRANSGFKGGEVTYTLSNTDIKVNEPNKFEEFLKQINKVRQ